MLDISDAGDHIQKRSLGHEKLEAVIMDSVPYADIVILALIAGFILLRLRSVLGQKNDTDLGYRRDMSDVKEEPVVLVAKKIVEAKQQAKEEVDTYLLTLKNERIAKTLTEIKTKDPQFSATQFLNGARMAYEMVFDSFGKGDKKTLEMLLSKDIYEHFASEIDLREKDETKTETTLVSIKPKDITDAQLIGSIAQLTVKFDSEQTTLVKDTSGKVIEGNPSHTHLMDDEWVFERDVSSKNPNWKIIET
jgi:predicted lipid-binding transport protein (Tim44 family)